MKKHKPTLKYEIECELDPEPFVGSICIDPKTDEDWEAEVRERLDRGDVWAWCTVRVVAIAEDGARGYSSYLGGCNYKDEAEFRDCLYFTDLCNEAREDLIKVEHSHRQGIQTKYFGPTDSRGSRVKVWAQAGVRYFSWDHALNPDQNHAAAAKMFATEWQWTGHWLGGALPDGTGYLFVNARRDLVRDEA